MDTFYVRADGSRRRPSHGGAAAREAGLSQCASAVHAEASRRPPTRPGERYDAWVAGFRNASCRSSDRRPRCGVPSYITLTTRRRTARARVAVTAEKAACERCQDPDCLVVDEWGGRLTANQLAATSASTATAMNTNELPRMAASVLDRFLCKRNRSTGVRGRRNQPKDQPQLASRSRPVSPPRTWRRRWARLPAPPRVASSRTTGQCGRGCAPEHRSVTAPWDGPLEDRAAGPDLHGGNTPCV